MFWPLKKNNSTPQNQWAPLDVRMHGSVTVGTKWQVVIPKEVRDMLDLNEGDSLLTITKYGKFVGFIKTDDVEDFINLLKAECNIHN